MVIMLNSRFRTILLGWIPRRACSQGKQQGFGHVCLIVPETKFVFQRTRKINAARVRSDSRLELVTSALKRLRRVLADRAGLSKFTENKRTGQFDRARTRVFAQRRFIIPLSCPSTRSETLKHTYCVAQKVR